MVPWKRAKRIDKPLARLNKGEKKKMQIQPISGMKEMTSLHHLWKLQRIIREIYGQLYGNNLDNWDKIDKFLERYKWIKPTSKGKEYLNRHIR